MRRFETRDPRALAWCRRALAHQRARTVDVATLLAPDPGGPFTVLVTSGRDAKQLHDFPHGVGAMTQDLAICDAIHTILSEERSTVVAASMPIWSRSDPCMQAGDSPRVMVDDEEAIWIYRRADDFIAVYDFMRSAGSAMEEIFVASHEGFEETMSLEPILERATLAFCWAYDGEALLRWRPARALVDESA